MNLLSIFQRNNPSLALNNPFKVDLHSHLLPNIDDGVQSLKESISLIKKFKLLGYTKLITTPHVISDFYPNTPDIIKEKLLLLQEEVIKEEIDIDIEAGAEYYVDMNFFNLIEDGELMTFMNHYVLFETSYSSKPIILDQIITRLLHKGYVPVLAHPERYHYLHHDIKLYKQLKAQGVLFQVNAKSLYDKSKPIYKIASKLIQMGLVDFIGSDAHRMHDLKKLESFLQSNQCKKLIKFNNVKNNNKY